MKMRANGNDLDELRGRHVLVLGDLILDRYTWGNAERVSPEAPVLVLRADEHEVRPGGAASVAVLLRHLEAKVTLAGVVGDDATGHSLLKILDDEQVNHDLVHTVNGRPTTTKERFVGRASNRHPHQMLRVDHETREEIDTETMSLLRDRILRDLAGYSAVLLSDYAKGLCTPELLQAVINAARDHRIPVIVDPARINDYSRYRRSSIITPNRSEAELATGIRIESPEDALDAGRILVESAALTAAFVTIDRDGIAVVEGSDADLAFQAEPDISRDVYDITGAGDMVVAVTGLCQAADWPLHETAHLANVAASLEIEQLGVAPVTWEQIAGRRAGEQASFAGAAASAQSSSANSKITTLAELEASVTAHRIADRSIVFTNGCFDLLHVGHISYLQQAATMGDVLIVAINTDDVVRRLKGPQRPVINELDRATMLAALDCVDHVIIFNQETPHQLLERLRPDILVKGGTTETVVGREVVEAYGGHACMTDASIEMSTTQIVSKLREVAKSDETNQASPA